MNEGQHNRAAKSMGVEPDCLGLNHSSASYQWGELGHVTQHLSAPVLSSVRITAAPSLFMRWEE